MSIHASPIQNGWDSEALHQQIDAGFLLPTQWYADPGIFQAELEAIHRRANVGVGFEGGDLQVEVLHEVLGGRHVAGPRSEEQQEVLSLLEEGADQGTVVHKPPGWPRRRHATPPLSPPDAARADDRQIAQGCRGPIGFQDAR